jgi:transposase
MSRFRPIDRTTDFLLPPSVQEWLPEAHLARYVAAVVENLDLSGIERAYAGRGSEAYHPAMLLSLLIYGYATGTFSSRKIERATYDSLAFRYLACNRHPDHDTLANFRRRFGNQFESAFVQVLLVAHENRFSSFGTVSLDGTKPVLSEVEGIHANASRHSALSYEHAVKLEAQLKTEVQELFALAEAADQSAVPDGMSVPAEIARREDQINLTSEKLLAGHPDDESRIMKVSGGGFEQCYNAQAAVDAESMPVIAPFVTQAANDKQQIQPALDKIAALPEGMNAPGALLADTGYFSEQNVNACIGAEVEPLISVGRDAHHPDWKERFSEPAPLPANATQAETPKNFWPCTRMKHTLKTQAGKASYGLRKQTVEPVFGIIKSVMGFRQFMMRGLEQVGHEWTRVCLAWNLKRMAVLRQNSV